MIQKLRFGTNGNDTRNGLKSTLTGTWRFGMVKKDVCAAAEGREK